MKTEEIAEGHYTALFWEYDSRLGRRWNQDPKPNPSISNYAVFANNPILYTDVLGDTIVYNLISKENEPSLWKKINEMVTNSTNDGIFIIGSHGSPAQVRNDNLEYFQDFDSKNKTNMYTAQDVADFLESQDEWNTAMKEGKDIVLILAGCNTAKNPKEHYTDEDKKKYPERNISEPIAKRVYYYYKGNITVKGTTGYAQYAYTKDWKRGSNTLGGKSGIVAIHSDYPVNPTIKFDNRVWITYYKKLNLSWRNYHLLNNKNNEN